MSYPGISGVFFMLDTFGLPLGVCFDHLENKGLRPALDVFVYDAVSAGWSFEKAIATVWECWADKYGQSKADELKEKLEYNCKIQISSGILKNYKISDPGLIK